LNIKISMDTMKEICDSENMSTALVQYLGKKNPLSKGITDWLTQLALLYGVPFNNLVPDEKMLPMESLRFFYLDQNWLKALIEGAFSIGIHSCRDITLQRSMMPDIYKNIYDNINILRKKLREELPSESEQKAKNEKKKIGDVAGMLLRSQLVSGWQGLEVKAYHHAEAMTILRMDRLAPDVLLVIFDNVPTRVEIIEPSESLIFGFSTENEIPLRHIAGDNLVGKPTGESLSIKDVHYRNKGKRVLDITAIQEDLKIELDKITPNQNIGDTLSPAAFAVQMVKSAIKQTYGKDAPKSKGIEESSFISITEPPPELDDEMLYNAFFGN